MKAAVPRVSFADMEGWPEDGRRYELYDGEVFEIPAPRTIHQVVLGRLYIALAEYVRTHGGTVLFAPLDIVLTEYDLVQPDLVYFSRDREHLLRLREVTRHAPDLAIEILSPGTAANDRGRKAQLLARHHVREYWLIDPDASAVEVFTLAGDRFEHASTAIGNDRVSSSLLRDLDLRPADIIPPDDRAH